MQNNESFAKKNFGRLFMIELLILFFSLVPLIVIYMAPAIVNLPLEQFTDGDYLMIYGLITYILFPVISVLMGFLVTLMNIKWYAAAACGPLSYLIGALLFIMPNFGIGFAEVMMWVVIDYIIALLCALLAHRWRQRREDVNRLMPTKAASKKR